MSHQDPEQSGGDRPGGHDEPARHDDAYERPGQYGRAPGAGPYGEPRPQGWAGPQNPGWGQQPWGSPGHGWGRGYVPPNPQAQSKATTALVLGIVGIATGLLGVVLGPIGLVQARQAGEMGADATAGRVLSWIALGSGLVGVLWLLFVLVAMVMTLATVGSVMDESTSRALAGLAPV